MKEEPRLSPSPLGAAAPAVRAGSGFVDRSSHRPEGLIQQLAWAWLALTRRPGVFLAVTSIALFLLLAGLRWARLSEWTPVDQGDQLRVGSVLGVWLVQVAAVMRYGRASLALLGGLAFSTAVVAASVVVPGASGRVRAAEAIQAWTTLASLSVGLSSLLAVGAGLYILRRQQAARRTATRQQLLERLFEVRQRLQVAVETDGTAVGLINQPWAHQARSHVFSLAVAVGLGLGSLSSFVLNVVDPQGQLLSTTGAAPFWIGLVSLLISVTLWSNQVAMGFLAGRPVRAIGAGTLAMAGTHAGSMMLSGPYGSAMYWSQSATENWVVSLLLVVLSWIGSLGARLEEHSARQRQFSANHREALNQEREELERLLRPAARRLGMMAVDVKSSSKMKAEADPFDAEWTFREFQRLVSRVTNLHLGTIYSTAGDGAIAGFPTARAALEAALDLHAEIETFNRQRSRLTIPFRLRIGLNAGEVDDALHRLEFTTVIDLAANAEALAPVGGIAATMPVVEETPDLGWLPSGLTVEGVELFFFPGLGEVPA